MTQEKQQKPHTSLGALVASRRPTLPATPEARRKTLSTTAALRWVGLGLVLSLGPIAVMSQSGPELSHHVLHGAAEIKRAPNGDQVRWRRGETKIFVDSSVERYGPRARDAIHSAFGTWLELDTHAPRLTFDTSKGTKFSLEPDGKNSVLVAPITLKGHEDDLAITLAFWDERTGSIAEVDVVINAKVAFSVLDDGDDHAVTQASAGNVQEHRQCDAYDLQNVLTHEVGHFMGLGEDMLDDGASMYFRSHRCETQKRTLATGDESSILSLYVDPASEDGDEMQASSCTFGAPGTGNGALLAVFVGLAAIGLRRRR